MLEVIKLVQNYKTPTQSPDPRIQESRPSKSKSNLQCATPLPLGQALHLLGLTELPSTRGQLFVAAYSKMKDAESSEDENFPTRAELRQAREVCKAAFDLGTDS